MQKYFKKLTMSFPKIPFLPIKKKRMCLAGGEGSFPSYNKTAGTC